MKSLKIIINLVVLIFLSIVESTRLNAYINTFINNNYISFSVAISVLLIVFYFEFEQMLDMSKYATIACIVISLLSYAEPIKQEFEKSNRVYKKELIPIPEFQFQGKIWHEKIAYIEQIKLKTEHIKVQNLEITKWNESQEKKGVDWFSLFKLVITGLLFSFFFPVAVYNLSHRLSEILRNSNITEDRKILVLAKIAFTDTPIVDIAQEYDISRDSIYRWMKEYKVEPRKQPTKKKSLTDVRQEPYSNNTQQKIIITGVHV